MWTYKNVKLHNLNWKVYWKGGLWQSTKTSNWHKAIQRLWVLYNEAYLLNNYSQWNTNKYVNIQYKAQNVQKYLVGGSNHIININLISVRANLIQKVQPMPRWWRARSSTRPRAQCWRWCPSRRKESSQWIPLLSDKPERRDMMEEEEYNILYLSVYLFNVFILWREKV